MSDADREDTPVSTDGITVKKSINADQPGSATAVLKIRSDRSDAILLQVREALPPDSSQDDVGFHPDYGDEYWHIDGETLVFERSFTPDEEFTTVYGIRNLDEDAQTVLAADPTIEVVETKPETAPSPPGMDESDEETESSGGTESDEESGDLEDIISKDNSKPIQDLITNERETLPGLSRAGDAGSESQSGETAEASATEGEADTGPVAATETETETKSAVTPVVDEKAAVSAASGDSATGDVTTAETQNIASALAEQLRNGSVSEADKEVLREELGTAENSTEARVQHLQNEVSDLAAYTDALEEFIDEEGTAQQILDDLETEIGQFDDRLADVERRLGDDLDDLGAELERLDESVSAIESRAEVHENRLDDHDGAIQTVEDSVDDVETTQSSLESDVGEVQESLEEMKEFRERLTDVLSRLTGGMDGDEE